jgi:hypothetical protein
LAQSVAQSFGELTGKCPWIIVNNLRRNKLDANRPADEATGGDSNALTAYNAYHDFINDAIAKVESLHGNDGADGGVNGVLLDLHGYEGVDWRDNGGNHWVQYGYRLSENTLNVAQLAATPTGSVTHAAEKIGVIQSVPAIERLVRGDLSFGQLVPKIDPALVIGNMPANCGRGLPSPAAPNPKAICSGCNYFSGGCVELLCHFLTCFIASPHDYKRARTHVCNLSGIHLWHFMHVHLVHTSFVSDTVNDGCAIALMHVHASLNDIDGSTVSIICAIPASKPFPFLLCGTHKPPAAPTIPPSILPPT